VKTLPLLLAAGLLPAAHNVLAEPATNPPTATLTLNNPPSRVGGFAGQRFGAA
jgi:hypothetical protein